MKKKRKGEKRPDNISERIKNLIRKKNIVSTDILLATLHFRIHRRITNEIPISGECYEERRKISLLKKKKGDGGKIGNKTNPTRKLSPTESGGGRNIWFMPF